VQVAAFHPGTQHSWQTAQALQQLGRLEWYATSIFYKPDAWPYRLERLPVLGPLLSREFRRFDHPGLDSSLVRTYGLLEWMERIAARSGGLALARWLDAVGNSQFAAGIARDLRSSKPFALWGYNGSSERAFRIARSQGRTCILDRTIGDYRVYNALMKQVAERYGEWFLPTERIMPQSQIDKDTEEYDLADHILVGSPYAEQTIRQAVPDNGTADKVQVLNYCYDERLFGSLPSPAVVTEREPVRFLFLGLVIPRKGIHHVLEAIARIPRSAAELTIVGAMKIPREVFAPYADRVRYIPTVARADVPRLMREHHVFLLPSYFEGAGITLYEALASGNALIQSDRCAMAVDEQTGILLDDVGTQELYAAMMQAIENRPLLNTWRANAQARAREFSFARYRENIAAFLDGLTGPT